MADPSVAKIASLEKVVADMMAQMQHLSQQNAELLRQVPNPSVGERALGDPPSTAHGNDGAPSNGADLGGGNGIPDVVILPPNGPPTDEPQASHAAQSKTYVGGEKGDNFGPGTSRCE